MLTVISLSGGRLEVAVMPLATPYLVAQSPLGEGFYQLICRLAQPCYRSVQFTRKFVEAVKVAVTQEVSRPARAHR